MGHLVRAERLDDADEAAAVRGVHLAAFGAEGPVVAALVDDLRALVASANGLSLVAEDLEPGEVVGHVMTSRGWVDAPRRLVEVQVLSPLGVRPGRQRTGVGTALVRSAVDALAATGVPLLALEGDPAYYHRFGFRPGVELGIAKPSARIPDAAFQVLPLPAYDPDTTGAFVYPDVFWRHDAVGLREAAG